MEIRFQGNALENPEQTPCRWETEAQRREGICLRSHSFWGEMLLAPRLELFSNHWPGTSCEQGTLLGMCEKEKETGPGSGPEGLVWVER